jgi:ubiquinone/menaquinone biosynthesis C-methylase UbiE
METNYWNKKASDYDNHLKKSENAYLKIIELIKKESSESQTLLDIGTGTGEIPIALSDNVGKIIATDFSQEMISIANLKIKKLNINNITFQVQDCYNLSYSDEMFDIIVASNLLHILDKPEQFLNSIKRLLKKNGKLIVPTYLHNESIKTKIISKILKLKGHPINTRFESKSMIEFITKCGYNLEKSVFIESIMPMLFVVVTKK